MQAPEASTHTPQRTLAIEQPVLVRPAPIKYYPLTEKDKKPAGFPQWELEQPMSYYQEKLGKVSRGSPCILGVS
jgi:hypothetical protein